MRAFGTVVLVASVANAIKLYPRDVSCPDEDKTGEDLSIQGGPDSNGLTCIYAGGAGACQYNEAGDFIDGSDDCPNISGTTISISCDETDNDGSALQSQTGPDQNGLTCVYETAGECDYAPDGSLSSGSSSCPGGTVTSTVSSASTSTAFQQSTSSGGFFVTSSSFMMSSSSIPATRTPSTRTTNPTSGPSGSGTPGGDDDGSGSSDGDSDEPGAAASIRPGLLITVLGLVAGFAVMF